MVGSADASELTSNSLEQGSSYSQATYSEDQLNDGRALLALRVNGAELSLDHGYPARVIIPAVPGVHNTKWVDSLVFRT